MRNHLIALVAGLVLLLAAGAGTAMAQTPVQAADQSAGSTQSASSTATSTQTNPTNRNVDVRIFSPGDNGAVSQSNTSSAASAAGNANQTAQNAAQSQGGGNGGGGQAASQSAGSTQTADSTATSVQDNPSNSNTVVRIDSPGSDGPVTQTNDSQAESAAGNANATEQDADQEQGGGGHGGGGVQAADQSADNEQSADSSASSTQTDPSNGNVGVRIHSPGDGGDVSQSNESFAGSAAGNLNLTGQEVEQGYGSGGGNGGGGVQAVGQEASSEQDAVSTATSTQDGATNSNIPVRIDSSGDDGDVSQSNESFAGSLAGNLNLTGQEVEQGYGSGGGNGGGGVQAVGQQACIDQSAESDATSTQNGATNSNTPVRIGSEGDDGDVTQTNASAALSTALNANLTDQSVAQEYSGGGGVQAVGQLADSAQDAASSATSEQEDPTNENAPVRIGSDGGAGDVEQTNASLAASLAANANETDQDATQLLSGDGGYAGVQALGQLAFNDQAAGSAATSSQSGATNAAGGVSIAGPGGGGSLTQTNASVALSAALNLNRLFQAATQRG